MDNNQTIFSLQWVLTYIKTSREVVQDGSFFNAIEQVTYVTMTGLYRLSVTVEFTFDFIEHAGIQKKGRFQFDYRPAADDLRDIVL
jgi:hypothetical protein